jgi:hypothetical protein
LHAKFLTWHSICRADDTTFLRVLGGPTCQDRHAEALAKLYSTQPALLRLAALCLRCGVATSKALSQEVETLVLEQPGKAAGKIPTVSSLLEGLISHLPQAETRALYMLSILPCSFDLEAAMAVSLPDR